MHALIDTVSSGYSATPQARKLGIRAGMRVAFVNAASWQLADPPDIIRADDGPTDVVIWFVRNAAELADTAGLGDRIFPDGALWIAWPRKAAGHASDVTENLIREAVLPLGLVDVKVAAIDDDCSGLKIVWRKENRTR